MHILNKWCEVLFTFSVSNVVRNAEQMLPVSLGLNAGHLWPLCRLFQDNDLLDKRKHCFSVQTEGGEDMFFSVELDSELLIWEKAFQTATFLEVERIQVRSHGDRAGTEVFGFLFPSASQPPALSRSAKPTPASWRAT